MSVVILSSIFQSPIFVFVFFSLQIPLVTNRPHGYGDTDVPAVPSFADVQWVFDDEGESFARTRYKTQKDTVQIP